MREELYRKLKLPLCQCCGEYYERPDEADMDDELYPRAIKHIDLWNHNVEFLSRRLHGHARQCSSNCALKWHAVVPGVEYRAQPLINLHV